MLLPRRQDVEYDASHHGEYFYIRTNDQAKNFRLMRIPVTRTAVAAPSSKNWQEVIPARAGSHHRGRRFVRRSHRRLRARARPREDLHSRRSGALSHYIEFPEPVYTVGATGNVEYKTNLLRFNYTSLVTPPSVFDYNVHTREREVEEAV